MSEYQVIARKYRPKKFSDVVGQDAIVKTLLNAIAKGRVAHAYLFAGTRGTGKTTLARLLARALNCQNPGENNEPCNSCTVCRDIIQGSSMDVLEIDGASHRGIEDIRQINEGVTYVPTSGKVKIYLIDEVHMLTKEAFNALLKTLEEPPANVKFFFATTEPHKVPATILSRCQIFNLNRIPTEKIEAKLTQIAQDLEIKTGKGVLRLIAYLAEGSMRDAESLFEQVRSELHNRDEVFNVLGLLANTSFYELDKACASGDIKTVFSLAHDIFHSGKNLSYFLEQLSSHYRKLLLLKVGDKEGAYFFEQEDEEQYTKHLVIYSQSQLLKILEILSTAMHEVKFAPKERIYIEMVLLKIIRTKKELRLDELVERLENLENGLRDPSPIQKHEEIFSSVKKIEEPPSFPSKKVENEKQKGRHETMVQFAAKELDGLIQR
ncbi:MAG: DNA polymerase III subunit gamma/tau [Chlamydiia bacterium]|nr:DNA polymerase III subunit gamma/tau [Chlamydiia bacterium]